jgi:hypothetical protein
MCRMVQAKFTLLMFLVNPLNTSNTVLDLAENMRTFSISVFSLLLCEFLQ